MKNHYTLGYAKTIQIGLIAAIIVSACSSSTPAPTKTAPVTQPAGTATLIPPGDWPPSSPENEGLDPQPYNQMMQSIREKKVNVHSILVIRHGRLAYESYFPPYNASSQHVLYSCTKSFIGTLIGIAIDQGKISRVDQNLLSFFPGQSFANSDSRKQAMTLQNLLTMTTGLDWSEGDPEYRQISSSSDWVKYMLDKRMAAEPGKSFNYCSGCSHILSAIIQKSTGQATGEFARRYLFEPLGITNYSWDTDAQGLPIGGWGLYMTPRDMAKLGYLYLRQGNWYGSQIVSAKWVAEATQKHIDTSSELGYGYQWWTYPKYGAYAALGRGGQTIFVIPRYDIVIVTTAELDNHDPIFALIEDYIIPSIKE